MNSTIYQVLNRGKHVFAKGLVAFSKSINKTRHVDFINFIFGCNVHQTTVLIKISFLAVKKVRGLIKNVKAKSSKKPSRTLKC